jgi:hypothetical protein
VVELPLPRTLPCAQFQTVELELHPAPGQTGSMENAAIEWRAGGREWHFVADLWHQPPQPLDGRALPRQVRLLAPGVIDELTLTLYCRRYERTLAGDLNHDSDPFTGLRWSCKADGCNLTAGFPLGRRVARSPRRLRLCADPATADAGDESGCGTRRRNVSPAFEDERRALALAGEILADARRTLADACAAAHGCSPHASALAGQMRPAAWRSTSFAGLPVGMTLKADAGGRALVLGCSADATGDVRCELKVMGGDRRLLFSYWPIGDRLMPEADLSIDDQSLIWMRAEQPDDHDVGSGCTVSGSLLRTR